MYIAALKPKTKRRLEDRELNQARSKPNTETVGTAHIFVHHYNSTQYCNTETVFIYIPLPPDQHHISDVANCCSKHSADSLSQFFNILNLCLVDALLHCSPDFVVHHVKIWTVRWPLFWWNKVRRVSRCKSSMSDVGWRLEHCPAETRTHSLISALWLQ